MLPNSAFDIVADPLGEYFLALGSPEPGAYSDWNYQLSLAVDLAASSPFFTAPTLVPILVPNKIVEDFRPIGGARDGEPRDCLTEVTSEVVATRSVTMADIAAINEGLDEWKIPLIDIDALSKTTLPLWTTPSITEVPPGSPEFEKILVSLSDEDRAVVRPAAHSNGHDDGYPRSTRREGRHSATYLYKDHLGANHTRVEKWLPAKAKRAHFPQSFWMAGQGWVDRKPEHWQKIPYRLPEMLAALAKSHATDVFVPEGEKDCESLATLGLIATTSSEGATPLKAKVGKWTAELNKWFFGVRRLFILADNDEVGRRFAEEKARALTGIVPDIRIVHFSDVPEGEDVT